MHARRVAFNEAIAWRYTDQIGDFLLPSYILITGRSEQTHGREAAVARWERLLLDPQAGWERVPNEILVNEAWGLAQETGTWHGEQHLHHRLVRTSGVYAAKWQRSGDGTWRLQSEVFTTLACEPPDGSEGPERET